MMNVYVSCNLFPGTRCFLVWPARVELKLFRLVNVDGY
jgi:hypothetical protein